MRGVAGYDFRDGMLTDEKKQQLEAIIEVSADQVMGAFEWKKGIDTFLYPAEPRSMHVNGIGMRDTEHTTGIIWGSNEVELQRAIADLGFKDYFPYNVNVNTYYVVRKGGAYSSTLCKGKRVKTPKGDGRVECIEETICVELDDDKSILHEFDINEIDVIKEL